MKNRDAIYWFNRLFTNRNSQSYLLLRWLIIYFHEKMGMKFFQSGLNLSSLCKSSHLVVGSASLGLRVRLLIPYLTRLLLLYLSMFLSFVYIVYSYCCKLLASLIKATWCWLKLLDVTGTSNRIEIHFPVFNHLYLCVSFMKLAENL